MRTPAARSALRGFSGPVCCILGVAGCCFTEVHGIANGGSDTGGGSTGEAAATSSAAGSSSASASGSTTGGTSSGSAGTNSGGSSGTAGTTGTAMVNPPLGLLLDAGPETIFGPVALAAVPAGESQIARLAYAEGDGGQYGIMLRTLDSQGRPIGDALQLATTGDFLSDYGGDLSLVPVAPPDVTVTDDGTTTTICWADYSVDPNPDEPPICAVDTTSSVRCATVPDDGEHPDASYANCDAEPRLVFNPSDGKTQLFFRQILTDFQDGLVDWVVGQSTDTQLVTDGGDTFVATPLPNGRDGLVFSAEIVSPGNRQPQGLWLASTGFDDAGIYATSTVLLAPTYRPDNTPFAAAGVPSAGTAAILQYDGLHLRGLVWSPDAPQAGSWTEVPSSEPPDGAVALGVCPHGYAYLATTIRGHVLMTEGAFDGGLDTAKARYLALAGFASTPGLTRRDNEAYVQPVMSMATAPTPDGKLLLAISTPWQVAVFIEDCE